MKPKNVNEVPSVGTAEAQPSSAPASGSAPGKTVESERRIRVDMWDQECGTEGTVSNAVRRLTAQWGLPPTAEEKAQNV